MFAHFLHFVALFFILLHVFHFVAFISVNFILFHFFSFLFRYQNPAGLILSLIDTGKYFGDLGKGARNNVICFFQAA